MIWKDVERTYGYVEKLEAKRFWACLMFLQIMPPHNRKENGLSPWAFKVDEKTTYDPECRYDEFVASYASCSERETQFFSHYHRNMLVKFSLALQEADYVLRNENS